MLNRPLFWLGLLFGLFAALRLRLFSPRLPPPSLDFYDLTADALLLCDSTGAVVEANAAAQALFSTNSLPPLRYPTGQRVPPGQHPLHRASSARETVSGRYRFTTVNGFERILDISARPLPDGKAAAAFYDVTVQTEGEEREQAAQARQAIVQSLSRRLSLAQTAEAAAQAVAEETLRLLQGVPDVGVRLYLLDSLADTLTCLASAPEDRPKRPKSASEARPAMVRFDAQIPELWQMYVARKPSPTGLPLIAGGVAIGHLSVTPAGTALDPAAGETLEMIASLAALALARQSAAAKTSALTAQGTALREIITALSREQAEMADLVTQVVKRITQAGVCTLSVTVGGKLRLIGDTHKDDLLFPQTAPNAPCLQSKATQKAWKTQKTVTHLGVPNPSLEAGPWRAFAGSAGFHSIIALPLASHGVLSVYMDGASPLPDTQIRFLETVAALVTLSPATATGSEAGVN